MIWTVTYSAQARQDLQDIFEYIAYDLNEPKIAKNQTRRIMDGVHSLETLPMRHRLYDDEPWHSYGLRFFPIDNYLVFYLTHESRKTVGVVRIMYGGRDVKTELTKKE